MSQLDDEVTVVITNKPDSELYAVFEESNFDVNVGESGALQVSEGIQYIQSGKKEIGEAVAEVKAEITAHATQKTAEFDENAEQKINNFNTNATAKTQAFNTNATEKTNTFNQNASSLTADFNNNAATKTSDFERLAFDETADFERTVIESTDAFNDLFDRSRQIIREDVDQAATYAGNAYNYSNEAKKWAIGDPSEPTGNSAKYWANEAASELSGLTSRVSTIEGKIPAEASSSNQLTDKSYVDNMDIDLQSQIDALIVASDVFDIVGTYAELQAYDISTVPVNDIIKVLVDETHSGAATYYRCVENGGVKSWSYIGSEGAYYTKAEADSLFATPSDIGNATITLTQGGVTKGTFTTNQSGNATIDVDAATIPSNMVTTDTAQTITGLKTFTENNIIKNTYPFVEISNSTLTKGTNPTTAQYAGLLFEDKDANGQTSTRLGDLVLSVDSSGNVTNAFKAWNYNGSGSAAIRVIYPTNGTPYATAPAPTEDTTSSTQIDTVGARNAKLQNYALSSSLATVATSGSYNDLSNKPTIPTKTSDLTNDSGYITGINSSDVTTALGYTPADDSDVVKTSGNQTVGGTKTFSSYIKATSQIDETSTSNQERSYIELSDNQATTGYIRQYWSTTQNQLRIRTLARHGEAAGSWGDIQQIIDNNGNYRINISCQGTLVNTALTGATNSTTNGEIPTKGWVNNPDTSTNVLHRSGEETIGGIKTFNGVDVRYKRGASDLTTQSTSVESWVGPRFVDKNNVQGGLLQYRRLADGVSETNIQTRALSTKSFSKIAIYQNPDGTAYTEAPTPATSDNSTKIATTAYVKAQGYAATRYVDGMVGTARYATSTTAAATAEKVVYINEITSLEVGQCIIVQPTITSTVANSTIKLNDFTAYPMRYNNAAITTSTDSVVWNQNYPTVWMFNGTYWVFITHGIDSNTTYSAMSVAEGTAGTATSNRVMRADYLKQILDNKGYVDVSSNQDIGGTKTFVGELAKESTVIDIDTPSTDTPNSMNFKDKNGVVYTYIPATQFSNGTVQAGLAVRGKSTNAFSEISIYQQPDGTTWTYAPTPNSADNSNQIATTAFVKNQGLIVESSLGENGYVKFSNGFIIQWGTVNNADANTAVSLPTPFTTTNYSVTITHTGHAGSYPRIVSDTTPKTTSAFTTYAGGGTATANFSWQAMGI